VGRDSFFSVGADVDDLRNQVKPQGHANQRSDGDESTGRASPDLTAMMFRS
jgi:hypothetical protein